MSRNRKTAFASTGVCLWTCVTVAWAAPAGAQGLADVARKEEERRKTIPQPAKVYTNQDLRPTTGPAPSATGAPPKTDEKAGSEKDAADKGSTGTPNKDAAAAAAPVKDRAYWAGRLKALQEQLERDHTYADALQSRINALLTDFVNRDDPAQKSLVERDRLKAIAELDRLKQAIPNDKKAIDDLLEEARRAGVPPGWLR